MTFSPPRTLGSTIQIMAIVAEAIRDASPVPNGVLYAHVMPYMTLETYQGILAALKREQLITESAHELTWIGPPAPPVA